MFRFSFECMRIRIQLSRNYYVPLHICRRHVCSFVGRSLIDILKTTEDDDDDEEDMTTRLLICMKIDIISILKYIGISEMLCVCVFYIINVN